MGPTPSWRVTASTSCAAAGVTIAEGEAAIFRPDGEGGFILHATVISGDWEELSAQFAGDQ
jgi:hypothetical protein